MGRNKVYSLKSNTKGSSDEKMKIGYFRTQFSEEGGGEGVNLTAFLESSHVLSIWLAIQGLGRKYKLKTAAIF